MSTWPYPEPDYRLWINNERTVLVRLWASGTIEVSVRPSSDRVWGPPFVLDEEATDENPRYGPGNPDWEHDRAKDDT